MLKKLVQGFINVVWHTFFSPHPVKAPSSWWIKRCVRAGRGFVSQILQDLSLTKIASLPSSEFHDICLGRKRGAPHCFEWKTLILPELVAGSSLVLLGVGLWRSRDGQLGKKSPSHCKHQSWLQRLKCPRPGIKGISLYNFLLLPLLNI